MKLSLCLILALLLVPASVAFGATAYPPQFEGAHTEVYKEMGDLKLQVRLKPVTDKPDAPTVAEFPVDIKNLGAFEATDVSATAKTNLRAYEFPDWQFLRAEFEITSP